MQYIGQFWFTEFVDENVDLQDFKKFKNDVDPGFYFDNGHEFLACKKYLIVVCPRPI